MTKIKRDSNGLRLPAEVQRFKNQKAGETTKNTDGSVTKRRQTAQGSKELTTREGKLLETTTEFRRSSTTKRGTQSESSFTDHTDMIGRRSTSYSRESVNAQGDRNGRVQTHDVFGIDKDVRSRDTTRVDGNTTTSSNRVTTRDSLGNASTASDVTRVTEDGKSVITRNEQRARGSELTTRSSTTYENGRFTLSDGADWSKRSSVDRSYLKETEFDSKPYTDKADKITPWVGKVFRALGLEHEWSGAVSPDRMKETTLVSGAVGSVSTRVGIAGEQRLAINADGIQASFNREAKAGIYAQAADRVEGRYGTAEYTARAQAEAKASIDAQGRIDANGLDATVTARAGVSAEAEVTGRAATKSVTVGGVEFNAAADGRAKVSAEAVAEATGTVAIKRNPPTAIARGTAGASAVVKAEAEVKLSAGPFSVTGSAYASAGAEARATGVIGYEDGKLKIGGSAGAALGLGAGAGVTVEVDVRAIGEAAKGLADVNHDGKLDLADVGAAAKKAATVATTVARTAARVADANHDGKVDLRDVGAAAGKAATAVSNAASNVAHKAADVAHSAARKVAGWFGW
ncbi:MAG: hypothetical protein ACOZQL_14000 [Myxococcota bacterium]